MNENDRESISEFRLIEMLILSKVFPRLACPNCYNTSSLKLTDVADKKKGLSSYLKVYCDDRTFAHKFYTSPVVTSNNYVSRGGNAVEINARAVYRTRSIEIVFSLLFFVVVVRCCFCFPLLFRCCCCSLLFLLFFADAAACLRKDEETADFGVSVDGARQ